jgi:TatD DNase family protein
MRLFDTHFHYYAELEPVAYRRKIEDDLVASGVTPLPERFGLLAAGGSYPDSLKARDFAAAVPDGFFAAGVHPHEAGEALKTPADFGALHADPRCVAVGEIGLDYFYELSEKPAQRRVFGQFLQLALETGLPAIVHCRDRDDADAAYADVYAALADFAAGGGRMVIHCFTGTPAWAEKFLALGAYLGVTGIVTFHRAENVRQSLRIIPPDRLLLETDSPYLAPAPFRGKPCSPGYLPLVAARVAKELELPLPELADRTFDNAMRFFNLTRES